MIKNLDEAISHCEEVAYQNEILMKRYDDASGYSRSHNEKIRTSGAKGCEQLISLYRQLAEWLRELKAYREGCKCEDCKYQKSKYCNSCYAEDSSFWEYKGEVNADAEIHS